MTSSDNFLSDLLKKPAFTLAISALAGFGIGFLYEHNKKRYLNLQTPSSNPAETPPQKKERGGAPQVTQYGEIPANLVVTIEELSKLMEQYVALLDEKKSIEEIIPRAFKTEEDLRHVWSNIEYVANANDLPSLTKGVSNPVWELIDRGGRRWRPILCFLIAQAFERKIDEVLHIASLIELVHTGFIMIDDIEDQVEIRRGQPAIHNIYGFDNTINAGCFMYFVSWFSLLKKYDNLLPKHKLTRLFKIYIQEMNNTHVGHAWGIYWHNCDKIVHIPTENQYLLMATHRYGTLVRLAVKFTCEILNLPNDVQKKLVTFSERIAVAFQIHTDVLDIIGQTVEKNETIGNNIKKGRMTLIMVHSLNHGGFEDKAKLIDILKKPEKTEEDIRDAIEIVNNSDSVNFARNKATTLIQEAWDGVKDFIPNNKFKGCLKTFAEAFTARQV